MKHFTAHFSTLFSSLCLALPAALLAAPAMAVQEQNASALVTEAWARYRNGVGTEQEQVRVRVSRGAQVAETKTLTRWTRFQDQGERVLIKFSEPAADRGLGLLIAHDGERSSQMWLRMPSWGQARKIAGDREARYFGGTDLSFEDNRQLLGEAVADFSYRLLRSDANGWQIEATPREAGSGGVISGTTSGYGKRLMQLAPTYAVTEIQYFDRNNALIKVQRNEDITVEPSGRWRAGRIAVDNTQEGSRSVFEITARRIGAVLPERLFAPAALVEE